VLVDDCFRSDYLCKQLSVRDTECFLAFAVGAFASLLVYPTALKAEALVKAAQVRVRSVPEWHSKYVHLMMRRGRKIAKVAMARRLAVELYWMWRRGEDYKEIQQLGSHVESPVLEVLTPPTLLEMAMFHRYSIGVAGPSIIGLCSELVAIQLVLVIFIRGICGGCFDRLGVFGLQQFF
jgi:hypothetical protein